MLQVKVEDGKVYVTINKSVSAGRLKRIKLSHCVLSFCVKKTQFQKLVYFPSGSEVDKTGEGDVQQGARIQTHYSADRRR